MNTILANILKFWLVLFGIVAAVFILVASTMGLMMIFVSAKVAGLIWCGFMLLGIIGVGSWWMYQDEVRERARRR